MAFVLGDRTRERTATTGNSLVLNLLGTLSPNQRTFDVGIGVNNETSYTIVSGDGIGFEEGFGHVPASGQFSRDTVTKNHLGTTARISLVGESRIFSSIPGDFATLFAKYFGGDFSKQILRYSVVTGKWEATLDNGSWKQSVALATNGALPSNTYANGSSGVGATLTATANAVLTIDGVVVRLNYRILVKNEASNLHNGIYLCTQEGDATHPYILTRSVDYDDPSDLSEGDCVAVGQAGTANGRTIWTMATNDSGINIGTTTDISWYIVGSRPSSGLDLFGSNAGDMLVRGSTAWQALAVDTDGMVLTLVSGLPTWANPSGGGGGASLINSGSWITSNSYVAGDVARYGADFYEANTTISASPTAAPSIDGHALANNIGSTGTLNLTTSVADDLIVLVWITDAASTCTVNSITSALSFSRVSRQVNSSDDLAVEIWTAKATGTLSSVAITTNHSSSANWALYAVGVSGANGIVPFDLNANSLLYSHTDSIPSFATSGAYDIVFYLDHSNAFAGPGSGIPTGFTLIDSSSYIPTQSNLAYRRYTSAISPTTLNVSGASARQAIAFAITADNAPPSLDSGHWVRLSGFDDTAFDTKIGATRGVMPRRGAAGWEATAAGTSGQVMTKGTDADWASLSSVIDTALGSTRGSMLVRGASNWSVLAPGTTGYVVTMGATDPGWAASSGGGGGGGVAPSVVQANGSVGANSSVTLSSAPTGGNILVAIGTHWNNGPVANSGWSPLLNTNGSSTDGLLAAYKVCGPSESATQTPFTASAGGMATGIMEITNIGGAPSLAGYFQESASGTLTLNSFNATSGLVVGGFLVQASSYDYTVSGATAVDSNVTGTTSSNSPRRVKTFHKSGASGLASITATLDAGHDSAGMIFFIPGAN